MAWWTEQCQSSVRERWWAQIQLSVRNQAFYIHYLIVIIYRYIHIFCQTTLCVNPFVNFFAEADLVVIFCENFYIPVPDWLHVSYSCWGTAVSSISLNLSSSLNTGKPFSGTVYSCLHSRHVNTVSSVFWRLSAIILSVKRMWESISNLNIFGR